MRFIQRRAAAARRRSRRFYVLLSMLVVAALVFAVVSLAGTVGTNAGFEDDDANLVLNGSTFDWNSFAPLPIGTATGTDAGKWNGTVPTRKATKLTSGWNLAAFEDYQATTSDNGFSGGTKQDTDCATIITSKAPNKDDLKRVYIANKIVPITKAGVTTNHVFLELGFVRIPLNSTQSSTHIGFEFNEKRAGSCGTTTSGLVKRTPQGWGGSPSPGHSGGDQSNPGDLLIVYDYEGSTTSPTLTYRQWIDSNSTVASTCEISNDTPPCWSPAKPLTAAGYAEAQVNFGANGVDGAGISDALAPGGAETLGLKEFGEAGIDLTDAGIFGSNICTGFGQSDAVSRSSGNSGQAQMEDLVSGPVNISNCAEIKIIKQTKPRGLDQKFSFTSGTVSGTSALSPTTSGGVACTAGGSAGVDASGNFCLNDKNNSGKTVPPAFDPAQNDSANTIDENQLQPGTYSVSESSTDPSGFAFDSVTCKVNGTTTTLNSVSAPRTLNITLNANDVVVCVYQNNQQLGAIDITKTAKNANCAGGSPPTGCSSGKAPLAGAGFEIWQESNGTTGLQTTGATPDTKVKNEATTGSDGTKCFDSLAYTDATHPYYVHESTVPTGYTVLSAQQDQTDVVGTNASCSVGTPDAVSVENVPLSSIQVKFTSLAGTGVTKAQIVCAKSGSTVAPVSENGSADTTGPSTFDDTDETFGQTGTSGLQPGTYTCTVDVDP